MNNEQAFSTGRGDSVADLLDLLAWEEVLQDTYLFAG